MNIPDIIILNPYSPAVVLPGILDIHSYIIYKPFLHHFLQLIRKTPVCIELQSGSGGRRVIISSSLWIPVI